MQTNVLSVSTAATVRLLGKRYYHLSATIELTRRLQQTGLVDSVEIQLLAEWNEECPPLERAERRLPAWKVSEKYSTDQLAHELSQCALPIRSVHANRDVGILLCREDEQDRERGRSLIDRALRIAQHVEAPICVFHLWDTWSERFEIKRLIGELEEMASGYPGVKASIENVPVHLPGRTPADLLEEAQWITLDIRWAAMYDELGRYAALINRIANVHLRGELDGDRWHLDDAPFGFYEALDTIVHSWGYQGPLTMEPGYLGVRDWNRFVSALSSIRDGM